MRPDLTLSAFQHSASGRQIAGLLGRAAIVDEMKRLSRHGRPAVLAIDAALPEGLALDDTEKRHVGRWIRDELAKDGWRPVKRLQFRTGRLFSSGAVYAPPRVTASSEPITQTGDDLDERVARMQAMVRELTGERYGADALIRDRHAAAGRAG